MRIIKSIVKSTIVYVVLAVIFIASVSDSNSDGGVIVEYFIYGLFVAFVIGLIQGIFSKSIPADEKPKIESWICQNCQTELVGKEIKFGLCPVCGVKVKGFVGERSYRWYGDFV